MREIIPTVFAYKKKEFVKRFKILAGISRKLHVDFMDGKFVKNKGVALKDVPSLSRKINFEAHLMVRSPKPWIVKCKSRGFKKILFHYEVTRTVEKMQEMVDLIHKNKMKAFLTFNPETKIEKIVDRCESVSKLDGIMLMGVHPGAERQKLDPNVFSRLKMLRKKFPKMTLQVDGGVKASNAGKLGHAGANILNAGSFVVSAGNPRGALRDLRKNLA